MKKILTNKFRKIYFTSLIVLTAGILCWLVIVWLRLDTFEKSKPDNVASQVFNRYFKELAFEKLFELEKSSVSEFETLANYTVYLIDRAGSGEKSFLSISEDIQGIKKYVVLSDTSGFAEFSLAERAGFFGNIWELSSVRTVYDNNNVFKIVVPAQCDVFINNKPVGEKYKTGDSVKCVMAGTHDIYTVSELIAIPVVEAQINKHSKNIVFDSDLNEFSAIPILIADIIDSFTLHINGIQIDDSFLFKDGIKTDETNRLMLHRKLYRIPFSSNEPPNISIVSIAGKEGIINEKSEFSFFQEFVSDRELEIQLKDIAIAAAKTYAEFMTDNSNIRELQKYFQTETQIYQKIRIQEVYFYTPHIDNWFENVKASEFFARENDTFSCRVTFDHYVRRVAQEIYRFPLDITLFFKRSGGQYLVFDMISNG